MFRLMSILVLVLAVPALAVGPSMWRHTSEADFQPGTFENVVATNLGDLKLSRAIKTLLEQNPDVSSVYAIVESPDGVIYAGTGPRGVLMKIDNGEVSKVLNVPDQQIFSLLFDAQGRLLIGTGGELGRVLRIDKPGEEPVEIFSSEDVQYVWAMAEVEGTLYAATGPNGQLIAIDRDGKSRVLFDSHENNLLCMASDGKDMLYIGTDPNGLVYRVNRNNGDVYVLYDAAETEVGAIVIDRAGNVYAGTSAAIEGGAAVEQASQSQQGRPETGVNVERLPGDEPDQPEPPELPVPEPDQPEPIPQELPKNNQQGALPRTSGPVYLQADGEAETADGEEHLQPQADVAEHGNQAPSIAAGGNAIYRIDKEGFVTEIFRQQVMVLSMLETDDGLLVGTGNEGLIYQVNPRTEETLVLARTEPRQVMCLGRSRGGTIYLGLANVGGIATLSPGYAEQGTYISPVLDATQVSRFGKMQLNGSLPRGSSLTVSTRSGNVAEPGEAGWTPWSEEMPATRSMEVKSPPSRYLQYRITFKSPKGAATPVIEDVSIWYQMPNLAPSVQAIRIADVPGTPIQSPDGSVTEQAPVSSRVQIAWEAVDPNNDAMQYSLYYRSDARRQWVLLRSGLKGPMFEWETRGVPDGRYEIRVVASDELSNAQGVGRSSGRVSDPFYVDNTAPVFDDVRSEVDGDAATVSAKVIDRTSTISSIAYSIEADGDWQTLLPSDNIADSSEETVRFTVTGLKPGQRQITLRARDARGNEGFETVFVTIPAGGRK